MRKLIGILIFAFLIDGYSALASIERKTMPNALEPTLMFEDGFETDTSWILFEEIVGGNPCYGSDIGSITRSTDVAYDGSYSLLVWANQALSIKSNHVIGYKRFSSTGQTGIFRYRVHAYIDPGTENSGQTGPEFSMQNTRQVAPNEFRTSTAGIQYVANPYSPDAFAWKVWQETEPGIANWYTFMHQPISAGTWYTLTLDVDYFENRFLSFSIQGGGLDQTIDLAAYQIAAENKFSEEAFVLTLESENLWNNCGTAGVFEYKVYYDQVSLAQIGASIYLPTLFK